MPPEPRPPRTVSAARALPAPRARIHALWTDPARAGGLIAAGTGAPETGEIAGDGSYRFGLARGRILESVAPDFIIFTCPGRPEEEVRVEIHPMRRGRSFVVISHVIPAARPADIAPAEARWVSALARLENLLAATDPESDREGQHPHGG